MKTHRYILNFFLNTFAAILLLGTTGLFSNAVAQQDITGETVTVTDALSNHYSKYTISFDLANGNGNQLVPADNDSIDIEFGPETNVPSSISTSQITISDGSTSQSPNAVDVVGNRIYMAVPFNIGKGSSVTVTISKSANIRNPNVTGASETFSLDISSTAHGTHPASYTINQTTTQVTSAAVTPNPSIEQRSAEYTISFDVGSGGYLTKNSSTITIGFPPTTKVPNGSIAGVTLNGTSASVNGNGTDSVTVTTPVNVDNNGSVQIIFSEGSGLQNPKTTGDTTLAVYTSSETTPVRSDSYNISPLDQLSFSAVDLSNDTTNAASSYEITFVVSDNVDGDPENKGAVDVGEYITFTFSDSVNLPPSIATSNVIVKNDDTGFSGNPGEVTIDQDTVFIKNPIEIDDGQSVTVTIQQDAGIQQPAFSGNYVLFADTRESDKTTLIDAGKESNPYAIVTTTTTITQPTVSLSNSDAGGNSNYTVEFSTGDYGRLVDTKSEIAVIFPGGTGLTGASATVNGVGANSTTVSGDTVFVVPGSGTGVGNNTAVDLAISGLTNPTDGSYTLEAFTSTESTVIVSQGYTIGGTAITAGAVTLGNAQVNDTSSYSFDFTDNQNYDKNESSNYIKVVFPEGTVLPSTISTGNVSIGVSAGALTIDNVSVNTTERSITTYFTADQNNTVPNNITFATAANIQNPTIPTSSYYTAEITTSKNTQPASTSTYALNGNTTSSIAVDTVIATSSVVNASDVTYEIRFTPGANGKLKGGTSAGSDSVYIFFDASATDLPASIAASLVSVNGTSASTVSVSEDGSGTDTLMVVIPNGLTLGASTEHTINIGSDAGISNGGSAGTYSIQMRSSSEVTVTGANNLALVTSTPLTINSVSRSSNTVNKASSYTIEFTPGTGNGLSNASGDSITVTFPDNTYIPSPFSKDYVLINGAKPPQNAYVSGRTISVKIPTDSTLAAGEKATLQFSSTGGILNPTKVKTNYTLTLETSKEHGADAATSNQYSTTSTNSTVSTPDVTLANNSPSSTNEYTISFNTGTFGRLVESGGSLSASTITVKFPSATNYTTPSATVNGVTAPSTSLSGDEVTVTIPDLPSDSLWNNDDVSLVISGVTNPDAAGDYSLEVKSSVENSYVTSNSYPITSAAPVSNTLVNLNSDEVNEAGDYTIGFTVDAAAQDLTTADNATVTIKFPTSAEVPSSISDGHINFEVQTNGQESVTGITTDASKHTVTIPVTSNVAAGDSATVYISTNANIQNPKEPASTYRYEIKTSTQPISTQSDYYTIFESSTTSIRNLGVSVSPDNTSEPVNWTWGFRTGSKGALEPGVGTITLEFDQSDFSEAPSSMPTSAIKVNGVETPSVEWPLNADSSQMKITVPGSVTINNDDSVTVTVSTAAGIAVDPSLSKTKSKSKKSSGDDNTIRAANNYGGDTSAEGGTISTSNPLPIEMVDFKARHKESSNEALIEWKTATERDNFGFHVEKAKISSANDDTTWSEIAFVEGQGSTTEEHSYSVLDTEANAAGTYHYRIRQVDYDGNENLFGPVEMRVEAPKEFKLRQNYPNPFNPSTTIEYKLAAQADVQMIVYNVLGRQVQILVDQQQQAGSYKVNFEASSLASGVYFVRMQAAGNVFTKKMMLVK